MAGAPIPTMTARRLSAMATTSRRLLALLAAATLALGACGDDDDDPVAGEAADRSTTTSVGAGTTGDAATTTAGGSTATSGAAGSTTTAVGSTTPVTPGESGEGVIELSIVGGDVEGGVRREKVKQGSQVTLRVTSDVADEVHVHTYDLTVDLVPGQSADLTFLARIPGVHEIELEDREKKVLELEVSA